MADFLDGVFVKTVETQYGDIIKLSFDVDKFIDFVGSCEHVTVSEKNGRSYLNVEIKKSSSGKHYMAIDTWKPKKSDDNPFGD